MKKLYAMLTNHCNLSCNHCVIKDAPEVYNKEIFLDQVRKFDGQIIIFGGEPTVHEERLYDIIHTIYRKKEVNRVGLTSNLIKLNNKIINIYQKIGVIGSSWNYSRFTPDQYQLWLDNINVLKQKNVFINLLITLTPDLIDKSVDEFINISKEWNSGNITYIKFEQCIDSKLDKYHYEKVDNWLCELYKKRSEIPIDIEMFNKEIQWYYDCNETYTLTPDGSIHYCCPNGLYFNRSIPTECLTCPISNKCRPCRLQKHCSRPNKLKKLLESED